MQITKGRIVHYNTTEEERLEMLAYGNAENILPAIVTNVFENNLVNLKVFTDGENDTSWKTSVSQGDNEGEWNYPPRV